MKKKRSDPPRKPRSVYDPELYEFDPVDSGDDILYWLWAEEGISPDEVLEPLRAEYTEYLKVRSEERKAKKSAGKTKTAGGKRSAARKIPKSKQRKAAAKRIKSSAPTETATGRIRRSKSGAPSKGALPDGGSTRGPSGGGQPPSEPRDPTDGMTPKQKELYEAWLDFGHRLVPVLGALEEDEYLIINIKRTNRYVQFAGQGARGMRVEATSNFYLADNEKLGEAQHEELLKLGWRAPTNLPEEFGHEPVGSPNYFLDIPPPLDLSRIASLAVNTLIGPLDADDPGELEYKATADSGESVRFPTLGLKRAR